MPRVINLNTTVDGPELQHSEYVGRGTPFGNPFRIGVHGTRSEVIEKYRSHLDANPKLVTLARQHLRGKNLVCHCYPLACHADVLLRIANEE